MNIPDILAHYGFSSDSLVEEISSGSIHKTYSVSSAANDARPVAVLQQIRKLFLPEMMMDISAVTEHLREKGLGTLRVIKTTTGALCVEDTDGTWWRLYTYVPGRTVAHSKDTELINNAASFVGLFHSALADFTHTFTFSLPHFHDTPYVMERMKAVMETAPSEKQGTLTEDSQFILNEYAALKNKLDHLPRRIIHGDLKISNVRFAETGSAVNALIDLDTIMESTVPIELGDAFRSWCATGDEDTPGLSFDVALYRSSLSAYSARASFITNAECAMIPIGLFTITLELAARFLTDAVEESYFTLKKDRYSSLFEQNRIRASNQLSLYRSMKNQLILL